MSRKPDVPCSRCGVMLWSSPTSSPAASRVCLPCRRLQPAPRTDRRCNQDGCDDKHLARGMCRRHYYQARRDQGLDVGVEVVVLQALCHRGYALAPKVKSVRCAVPVGIMPDCPACESPMRPLSPHHFVCPHCWTDAEFNAEEVAWLASSVRRSTSQ